MPQSRHWQGQAPRASLLHPMVEPTSNSEPAEAAFVARCLLGPGVVGASRKISMLDLRVWAALCGLLHTQHLSARGEQDPDIAHPLARTVETTGYQLAERVCADVGGTQYRALLRSLIRLADTRACVQTVERDPELAAQLVRAGYVPLIGEVWLATMRLDLRSHREWGALKASTSVKVEIGHWTAQQIVAGRCTWLDLDLLRELGSGLAARVWIALEAWARWPQRSMDRREECAIGLGAPALQSLGVGNYGRLERARNALNRAGAQLVSVDPAYENVDCERRGGGWSLVVRRVCGPKARTQARQGAPWRSQGVAAAKRQRQAGRAERAQVRAAIHASLG